MEYSSAAEAAFYILFGWKGSGGPVGFFYCGWIQGIWGPVGIY